MTTKKGLVVLVFVFFVFFFFFPCSSLAVSVLVVCLLCVHVCVYVWRTFQRLYFPSSVLFFLFFGPLLLIQNPNSNDTCAHTTCATVHQWQRVPLQQRRPPTNLLQLQSSAHTNYSMNPMSPFGRPLPV